MPFRFRSSLSQAPWASSPTTPRTETFAPSEVELPRKVGCAAREQGLPDVVPCRDGGFPGQLPCRDLDEPADDEVADDEQTSTLELRHERRKTFDGQSYPWDPLILLISSSRTTSF